MMDKTISEVLENNLWSANKFTRHFKELINLLPSYVDVKLGRTVLHITNGDKTFKIYPHYNGRSNEYITLTHNGKELITYHYTLTPNEIVNSIFTTICE